MRSLEEYEAMPFADHKELYDRMPENERLFHIINLANYRYDHSPELEPGEGHSQSRGYMLRTVTNALIEKGYSSQQVDSARNRVIHGTY